jgi:hypothetical protein
LLSLSVTLGANAAGPVARQLATSDPDPSVRLAAARIVGARDESLARQTARDVLGSASASAQQRLEAAIDLARADDASGTAALAAATRDGETPDLRRSAVNGHELARRRTRGLIAALADRSPAVRIESARVLIRLERMGSEEK